MECLWGNRWQIHSSSCTHYCSLIVWRDKSYLPCSNCLECISSDRNVLPWPSSPSSFPPVMKCSGRDNLQQICTLRAQSLPPNFNSSLFCAHNQATLLLATSLKSSKLDCKDVLVCVCFLPSVGDCLAQLKSKYISTWWLLVLHTVFLRPALDPCLPFVPGRGRSCHYLNLFVC